MDLSPVYVSFKVALISTFINIFLSLACVYISMKGRGVRRVIDVMATFPMVLPPTFVGFIILMLFGLRSPIGSFLDSIGIRVVFTVLGAVIASSVVSFPLVYRSIDAGFKSVDASFIKAAKVLGAGSFKIFFRVMLPLAWPSFLSGVILGFSRALGEFGATLMVAGNIPGRTQTLPLALYFYVEQGDIEMAWLYGIIIVAIALAASLSIEFLSDRFVLKKENQ
ncbi:MAG: molybdate ABC transporter permease subunit [Thermoanaerobacteraceae bacterium]|nr:molybdate ABC transporter permease subunit [Thermoanaerobacteraceae bacterium]